MEFNLCKKALNNIKKYLINAGKKYYDNKYKLIFIFNILTLLNNSAEISNYMIVDYDFSFLVNNNYWINNFHESTISDIILFLDKPIYIDIIEDLNKIFINKTYHVYPQKLLSFYSLFSDTNIEYNNYNINNVFDYCINTNQNFNIFVNTFYTFSINKLFNNIYILWISNKIKYIDNQNENEKLYQCLKSLICNNDQTSIFYHFIPNLKNINHDSYLEYSLKWSYEDYNNYYKLLEKYYIDLNTSIEIIHKPKKKYIPASIKEIVWNKRAINGCVRCEVCNKILTPHTCHYSHYISEKNGGTTTPNNLTILCQACNLSMGSKNFQDFVNLY